MGVRPKARGRVERAFSGKIRGREDQATRKDAGQQRTGFKTAAEIRNTDLEPCSEPLSFWRPLPSAVSRFGLQRPWCARLNG